MKINGVKFIPSSLVTCFVEDLEVRIVELALEGFSFRTAKKVKNLKSLTLHFLQFEQSSYHSLVMEEYEASLEEKEFSVLYTILVDDAQYRQYASQIIKDYGRYISLKLSGDDSYMSEEMVKYPAKKDEEFFETFEEQKETWFSNMDKVQFHVEGDYELALNLDTKERYEQYLNAAKKGGIQTLQETMLMENGLLEHPLFQKKVNRLYIGNQFCHNLLPDKTQYEALLSTAKKEQLAITLVFTYLRDELVEEAREQLAWIAEWSCQNQYPIELVLNDWGMIKIASELGVHNNPYLTLNLGVLLNKRRKDPRYIYKQGIRENVDKLSENNLNRASFREWLQEKWHITRFEYDCGSLPVHLPEYQREIEQSLHLPGQSLHLPGQSLHLPYYQTNTSQFCPLYAKCVYGDRGNQRLVRNCPRYCEQAAFLYPKHLNMVGRFNSLFGFQESILRDEGEVNRYLKQGVDRIVLTVW